MAVQSHHPAAPSPSATIILVRQHEAKMEVYLLRRSAASKFMPGTYVFPGGSLEDQDMDAVFWQKHVDIRIDQLDRVLDGEVAQMLPFAVAAIRETWEEAGLLLATPIGRHDLSEDVTHRGTSFTQLIQSQGLGLCLSKLGRWHHWITPELMPRRFDTFFFTAPVEPGQRCRPDNHETDHGAWVNPREALLKNADGSLPLSPPTLVSMHQMLPFVDLDALMAEARYRSWPTPIMPRLWPLKKGALIIEPWDPDYTCPTLSVDVESLETDLLPVGAPFSRLWRHGGICRPVRHPDENRG